MSRLEDLRFAKVSPHAIQRFRERTGCNKSDYKVERRLRAMLLGAREVPVKPEWRLTQLLNHCGRDARYFDRDGMILVLEGDLIRTVHMGQADRWEAM